MRSNFACKIISQGEEFLVPSSWFLVLLLPKSLLPTHDSRLTTHFLPKSLLPTHYSRLTTHALKQATGQVGEITALSLYQVDMGKHILPLHLVGQV